MLIYWVLLAYPAVLALFYPPTDDRKPSEGVQTLALGGFVILYTAIAGLRYEVGGDWSQYLDIFEDIESDTLLYAIQTYDPLFGLLNWISAQLGTGVYLSNAVCAFIFVYGVVKAARRLGDPWLGITLAVPYLLIVVGMGYVRQSAALGLILLAIASFDQSRPMRTVLYLLLGAGFHPTALVAMPLFTYAITKRHKMLAVLFAAVAALAFVIIFAPQIDRYQSGYIDAEYQSGGAALRLTMSLLPSLLLLLRVSHFRASEKVRSVWISMAIANVACFIALALVSSSTAVDRLAVLFSPIQFAVFAEFRHLAPFGNRFVLLQRMGLIGLAVIIQVVWLVYATYASSWVPYQSILQFA